MSKRVPWLAIAIVAMASPAIAQDVLTVGGSQCIAGAPGQIVHVPVYVRDVSSTPLGVDAGKGRRIQAVGFKIKPSNPAAIAVDHGEIAVTMEPAGIAAALNSNLCVRIRNAADFSYIAVYDEATAPLPFNLDAAAPGDQFLDVGILLSQNARLGTTFNLDFEPSLTSLSNQGGTTTESVSKGNLRAVSGCIAVEQNGFAVNCLPPTIATGSVQTLMLTGPPQTAKATIAVRSSNANVATVPATIDLPPGATSLAIPVTAKAPGIATITATLPPSIASVSMSCTTTVANPSIAFSAADTTIAAGATATETLAISAAQANPLTIQLSSTNPASVVIPQNVTIPAGATSATFYVQGGSAGVATIMASLPKSHGGGTTATLLFVDGPALSVRGPATSAQVGGAATFSVRLAAAQSTATKVTLTSSDPDVATVPPSFSIGAGSTTATFTVSAAGVGSSTITISAAGATATIGFVSAAVSCAISPSTFAVSPLSPRMLTVTLSQSQPTATSVALAPSTTAVALPSTVNIAPFATSATFQASARFPDDPVTIAATLPSALGGASCTASAFIGTPRDAVTIGSDACIVGFPGRTVHVPVFIRDVSATPLGTDLGTSNRIQGLSFRLAPTNAAAIATVNGVLAAIVKPAGIAEGLGAQDLGSVSRATTVTYDVVYSQASAPLPLTLNAPPPGDQVADIALTLAENAPKGTVIDLDLDPSFSSGVSLMNSSSTVTETPIMNTLYLTTGCIQVGRGPIAIGCPSGSVVNGTTRTAVVTVDPHPSDIRVAVASSNASVLAVPQAVVIPAGMTSIPLTVTGAGAGTATITATVPGDSPQSSAECVATVLNPTVDLAQAATALAVGTSMTGVVTMSAPQPLPVVVSLNSSNRSVVGIPAAVTIPANATWMPFTMTAVTTGTAAITASLPGALGGGSRSITVTAAQPVAAPIPALDPRVLVALMLMLSIVAGWALRR